MKPIEFDGHNVVIAKDQPEYLPLPALVFDGVERRVVSCWKLGLWERLVVLVTGRLWMSVLTFGAPLQPQLPEVKRPFSIPRSR